MISTIEILVRTRGRPEAFRRMAGSVATARRTFPGRLVLHALYDGPEALRYITADKVTGVVADPKAAYAPNGYYAQARSRFQPGAWILHLDDDDRICGDLSVLAPHLGDPDALILFRARVNSLVLPPDEYWRQTPVKARISGIGFLVHESRWIAWPAARAGDFAVISTLYRQLRPVWVDHLLTETQGPPGRGACLDLDDIGRPNVSAQLTSHVRDAVSALAVQRARQAKGKP